MLIVILLFRPGLLVAGEGVESRRRRRFSQCIKLPRLIQEPILNVDLNWNGSVLNKSGR